MGFIKNAFKFILSPTSSRTTGILVILIIAAAIPLTVFIAQKQQELRQRAATVSTVDECINSCVSNNNCNGDNDPAGDCYVSCVSQCSTVLPPTPTPTPTPTRFDCSLQGGGGLLYSCFPGACPTDWVSASQNPNTTCTAIVGQTCCWYNPPETTPTPTLTLPATPTIPPCSDDTNCGIYQYCDKNGTSSVCTDCSFGWKNCPNAPGCRTPVTSSCPAAPTPTSIPTATPMPAIATTAPAAPPAGQQTVPPAAQTPGSKKLCIYKSNVEDLRNKFTKGGVSLRDINSLARSYSLADNTCKGQ